MNKKISVTVNVKGDQRDRADELGYHAYYADGVTAIEIQSTSVPNAMNMAEIHGFDVLYAYE